MFRYNQDKLVKKKPKKTKPVFFWSADFCEKQVCANAVHFILSGSCCVGFFFLFCFLRWKFFFGVRFEDGVVIEIKFNKATLHYIKRGVSGASTN